MSDWVPSVSLFRRGSAGMLVCGALVCAAIWIAGMPMLAASGVLLMMATAGAIRRVQEGTLSRQSKPQSLSAAPCEHGNKGMADRQMLEDRLDAEWKRDGQVGEPTALLLIAVDAFAGLQRSPGCAMAGEVAMLTLANTLTRMLPRGADLLARYDDSTFAVALRGTDLSGSLRVAARLRWAIVRLGIANGGTSSGLLTVCMGVAVQRDLASGSTEKLVRAAESALQAAQQLGADRLEYTELGTVSRTVAPGEVSSALPGIRAWTPEQAPAFYSPQG